LNHEGSALAPTFAFAAPGLDRAAERREDNVWLDRAWATSGRALVVDPKGRLLVDTAAAKLITHDATRLGSRPGSERAGGFLGVANDIAWFVSPVSEDDSSRDPETRFCDLRALAAMLPADAAGLAAYGRALLHWQSRKRHCGVCGSPTAFSSAGHRATCTKVECGAVYFPRTDPAIIVIVSDGTRCLLGRQHSWPERRFSTLAGFVEPGETLEAAVAREVFEESGVRIEGARYVASQPWPFPASLMVGFEAQAAHDLAPIVVGDELAEAAWFEATALIEQARNGGLSLPPTQSISYHLIADWCKRVIGVCPPAGPALVIPR
jgi:NAD+ diphosphatase